MSNKPQDALPPCTIEGEEAVLGSILINQEALEWVMDMISPQSFFLAKHAMIYQAMLDLHARKEYIDNITLAYELQQRKLLDDIGGHGYISRLINNTPTHINAKIYAAMIQEAYRRRRILDFAGDLARTALEGENSIEALAQIDAAKEFLAKRDAIMDDPYLIHASKLKDLPPITWLLPNEIPDKSLIMYFGPSGVGKSFVALDRAMQIAEGLPVVYIAAEGQNTFWARVEAWAKHHNAPSEHSNLHFYLKTVSLTEDQERAHFVGVIEKIKPSLIVIDTVAHCILPGDENNTRDMGIFIRGAQDIQARYGCSILFVHHTSKQGLRERGSTSLYNVCDLVMRITEQDDQILLECMKSKSSQAFPAQYLKRLPIEVEPGEFNIVIVPSEKIVQTKADPLTKNQRKVLETLQMEAYINGLSRTEISDVCEIPNGSVGRVLSTLIKLGYITQNNRGEKYAAVSQQSDDSDDSVVSIDSHNRSSESSDFEKRSMSQPIQPSHPSHQNRESKVITFGKPAPKTPCPNCKSLDWAWENGKWHCQTCARNRATNKDLQIYLKQVAQSEQHK